MTSVRDRAFFTALIHPGVNPYTTLKPGVLTAALSIESDHHLSELLKAVVSGSSHHSAGNPGAAVAGWLRDLVVGAGVNDDRSTIAIEKRR